VGNSVVWTVALCVLLLANANPEKLEKGAIALLVGIPLYFLAKRNRAKDAA